MAEKTRFRDRAVIHLLLRLLYHAPHAVTHYKAKMKERFARRRCRKNEGTAIADTSLQQEKASMLDEALRCMKSLQL
ncbi:hypothetical protein OPV22_026011 [Ensete ventricosum]|uniref:Uncharacterized protein n=1 Tax=Ensete ventricosum TaxID=4639 RepID=A0AAV8QKU8_ENSVE|nr:hypothetical protein OPV22_026011 [Ensete ventricosum]